MVRKKQYRMLLYPTPATLLTFPFQINTFFTQKIAKTIFHLSHIFLHETDSSFIHCNFLDMRTQYDIRFVLLKIGPFDFPSENPEFESFKGGVLS